MLVEHLTGCLNTELDSVSDGVCVSVSDGVCVSVSDGVCVSVLIVTTSL